MKHIFIEMVEKWQWIFGNSSKVSEALSKHSWMSLWLPLIVLDSLLRGIAQVCFANNPASGLFILAGLFAGDVRAGAGAILCSLVAIGTAKFTQQDDGAIRAGLTNFSAVLVGTVTAALYPLFYTWPFTGEIWLYMIATALFSVCVSEGLGVIIGKHNLPGYTLPFNIATSITFLCLQAKGYADPIQITVGVQNVTSEGMIDDVSESIEWSQVWLGSLLSVGQVYAVESVACSVLTLVGLLLCSPIIAVSCYIGGLLGTFTALAVTASPYSSVYAGVWGYNAFLSAGCLCFFMTPTPKIILMAVINAIFTTFLQAAIVPVFAANNLPVFTFPFCLSSLLFLALTTSTKMGSERVTNPTYPEHHLALHLKSHESTNNQTHHHKEQKSHPSPEKEIEV